MEFPQEIESGKPGWKKRRRELLILDVVSRATTPQSGWHIYQKVKRFNAITGDEACELMKGLADDGYLQIVGSDADCGYLYVIPLDA